ncbi:uracil-DNA glycosylase-like protein [Gymnopilus junonius]|uniref:Uracil-DNA glycosylase n=1 Tax=Gymnopilus junonius TaxID=109634 RepID=A0A9P5NW54_GYMJU|nr:uracil-DNA glycosylase-like protein [Gymnopilus junonius]
MTKDVTSLYLEDVDRGVFKKRPRSDSEEAEDGRAPNACLRVEKRQRTLFDMHFPRAQGKGDAKSSSAYELKQSCDSPKVSVDVNASALRLDQSALASGPLKLNAIPFSLSAYQESLSEKERSLLQLECETMGKSWLKVLKDEIKRPYFIALKEFLWKEGVRGIGDIPSMLRVYPPAKDIYSWSNATPLGKVKVVILGQDPYHGKGQAHGLCFSVHGGVAIPASLRNIYTEIKSEYPAFNIPSHGNLLAWANNGVLLLNSCLTVCEGEANSHANKGWEQFTDCILSMVDKYGGANLPSGVFVGGPSGFGRGVVFMAWGAYASKRVAKLDKKKHLILTSAHPSSFSANKGFLGNGHFKTANQWLAKRYGVESRVDWCSLH